MVLQGRTWILLPLFAAIVLSCLMLIPELHAHKTLIAVLLLLFLVLISLLFGGLDHRNCSCRGVLGLRCGCSGT